MKDNQYKQLLGACKSVPMVKALIDSYRIWYGSITNPTLKEVGRIALISAWRSSGVLNPDTALLALPPSSADLRSQHGKHYSLRHSRNPSGHLDTTSHSI
jgi:hypothetical protein